MPFETLDRDSILGWLHQSSAEQLERLWTAADSVRAQNVGYAVHLRGLVEISSHCVRQCGYCGLRAGNAALKRYRMNFEEIVQCAHEAVRLGYGTVVMQAGEDPGLDTDFICDVVRQIKSETPLAVTLSLGERPPEELVAWRNAGADRYLLRFETSDRDLYDRIHPPRGNQPSDRVAILRQLQEIGYETGSGIMVGIPGQSYRSVAEDLMLFRELDLDMIGIGPYIPHPQTPLGQAWAADDQRWHGLEAHGGGTPTRGTEIGGIRADGAVEKGAPSRGTAIHGLEARATGNVPAHEVEARAIGNLPAHELEARATGNVQALGQARGADDGAMQIPGDEMMAYRLIALTRILCPDTNIPATTALATINRKNGRELGLMRGANVIMPNLTPVKYRAMYEIYPDKACVTETATQCNGCLRRRIASIGRVVGTSAGSRRKQYV